MAINQDGEDWPCSFGGWERASLGCSFEQVRWEVCMRHPRAELSRHWLDRSSGPEEMYRLEINMGSHQQDLLVFIYLFFPCWYLEPQFSERI